jgi:hypothetical protein
MADQLPDWFNGGYGWDPSRLNEAETNTKYGIADWAIKNNVNLNNPDRDIAARIFEALKQRFPQLSLVNADTIDLGNGDGTIGVRPNDRNSNWDARQGQWNLSWIDPYHSNSQSNSAKLVSGQPAGNMPTYQGYQPPSIAPTTPPEVVPADPTPAGTTWPYKPTDTRGPTTSPDASPTPSQGPDVDLESIVQRALARVMI